MRNPNHVRLLRIPLAVGLAVALAGCEDRKPPAEGTPAATGTTPTVPAAAPDAVTPPAPTAPTAAAAPAVVTYTSQGLIANARETQGGLLVQIHHEPIPEFKDRTGKVIGMKEMVMDFPAQPSAMQGVAVGDAVTFTFEVDWTKTPAHRLMTVQKLPPGTELRIGTTAPDGAGPNNTPANPGNPGSPNPGSTPPGASDPRGGTSTPPPPAPANPK